MTEIDSFNYENDSAWKMIDGKKKSEQHVTKCEIFESKFAMDF
jgi:hypothetical protein